ncbi:hypothetical protein IFR05_003917 [Cadophora sp. M221]|nr:hypothetical protein IFR05_003917 [Cadophora sp. M221]
MDRIAGCTTINSSITIVTNTTVNLPNLVTVRGDVLFYPTDGVDGRVWDRQLVDIVPVPLSFSFPRLEEIQGYLEVRAETLQTLELPSLSKIGAIKLYAPALETWIMPESLQVETMDLYQHNIRQLQFPNLVNVSKINAFFDNRGSLYLNGTMSDDTQGTDIFVDSKNGVLFTSDLQNTQNTSFNLRGCRNITINSSRLGSFSAFLNPLLEYLTVPSLVRLSTTGKYGGFYITDNDILKEISFPNLVSVDKNFKIFGNEHLTTFVEGFSSLEYVGGAFEVRGNLTSFHLPKIVTVEGYKYIDSSVSSFNCSEIEQNFASSTNITCKPYYTQPPYTPDEEPRKARLSYSAKIGLGVGIAVFVVLSIGLGCGFCLWRSHRHPDQSGRAAAISGSLIRIWAKESFQKKPPSYPLQDFPSRRGDEPLPSYQPRPSSTATTLAPDVYDVSRPGTGTQPPQQLGVTGRSVASSGPVSPVSLSPPSPAHVSPNPGHGTLPPDYRP